MRQGALPWFLSSPLSLLCCVGDHVYSVHISDRGLWRKQMQFSHLHCSDTLRSFELQIARFRAERMEISVSLTQAYMICYTLFSYTENTHGERLIFE